MKKLTWPQIDLSQISSHKWEGFEVDVIDSAADYLELLQTIFNFPLLRQLLQRPDFHFVYDSMSGVTGPYEALLSFLQTFFVSSQLYMNVGNQIRHSPVKVTTPVSLWTLSVRLHHR